MFSYNLFHNLVLIFLFVYVLSNSTFSSPLFLRFSLLEIFLFDIIYSSQSLTIEIMSYVTWTQGGGISSQRFSPSLNSGALF